jgi:subtilisin family serine protease
VLTFCWSVMQGADEATILNAVGWCVNERDRLATQLNRQVRVVISMSLGGPSITTSAARSYASYANREGVMIVAAAGNEGPNRIGYPAGLPEVVSVGAVDRFTQLAPFSNTNTDVEISAPGVDTQSWYVPSPQYARVDLTGGMNTIINPPYASAVFGSGTVTNELVSCGLATALCPPAVSGKFCLVDRGVNDFCQKVRQPGHRGAGGTALPLREPRSSNAVGCGRLHQACTAVLVCSAHAVGHCMLLRRLCTAPATPLLTVRFTVPAPRPSPPAPAPLPPTPAHPCCQAANCVASGGRGMLIVDNIATCSPAILRSLSSCTVAQQIPTVLVPNGVGTAIKTAVATAGTPVTATFTFNQFITPTPYGPLSGTSMATPHVSSATAVVWATNPRCPTAVVRQAIKDGASKPASLFPNGATACNTVLGAGCGVVNIPGAITKLAEAAAQGRCP